MNKQVLSAALDLLNKTQECLGRNLENHRNPSDRDTVNELMGLHDNAQALKLRNDLADTLAPQPLNEQARKDTQGSGVPGHLLTTQAAKGAEPVAVTKKVCFFPDCNCPNYDGKHCDPEQMAVIQVHTDSAEVAALKVVEKSASSLLELCDAETDSEKHIQEIRFNARLLRRSLSDPAVQKRLACQWGFVPKDEVMEKDAARYRYLRDTNGTYLDTLDLPADVIDEAIDADMAAAPQPEPVK